MLKHFILVLLFKVLASHLLAQTDTNLPPYKRFTSFPPVKLLKPDSTLFDKNELPKKNAVMLMLFNPQCSHCQHETEEMIRNIDAFKKIQIIMSTTMDYDSMVAFTKKYELNQYPNIVVGRDIHYFLPSFYKISNLPYLAFYSKNKELISTFEGALPIPQILKVFAKKED